MFVVIVVIISGSYWVYRNLTYLKGQERVTVQRGTFTAIVETAGQVQPVHEAKLSLQTGGILSHMHVKTGDRVVAGDVLLEVNNQALQQQLHEAELSLDIRRLQLAQLQAGASAQDVEAAKANLAAAEARLAQVRAHPTPQELDTAKAALDKATMLLSLAQSDYDKIAWMPNVGMLPQAITLQQATADYAMARANYETTQQGPTAEALRIAQSEVTAARAQLTKLQKGTTPEEMAIAEKQVTLAESARDQAQQVLAQAQLLAPFAGTVLSVEANEGEDVYAHNPLVLLADLSSLEITAQIDELDVGEVAVGQVVEIHFDAFPGQSVSGQVQRLAPAATPQRGSTMYEATVRWESTNLPVRPGMAANLTITTEQRENVLLVPNRAIQTLGRRKVVRRLEGSATRQVEITTGLSNLTDTEVLDGLREGDVLIIE